MRILIGWLLGLLAVTDAATCDETISVTLSGTSASASLDDISAFSADAGCYEFTFELASKSVSVFALEVTYVSLGEPVSEASYPYLELTDSTWSTIVNVYESPLDSTLRAFEAVDSAVRVLYYPNGATPTAFTITARDIQSEEGAADACFYMWYDPRSMWSGAATSKSGETASSEASCMHVVAVTETDVWALVPWARVSIDALDVSSLSSLDESGATLDSGLTSGSVVAGEYVDLFAEGGSYVTFSISYGCTHAQYDVWPAPSEDLPTSVAAGECGMLLVQAGGYPTTEPWLDMELSGGVSRVVVTDGGVDGATALLDTTSTAAASGTFQGSGEELMLQIFAADSQSVSISGTADQHLATCGAADADGCGVCDSFVDDHGNAMGLQYWHADDCATYRMFHADQNMRVKITVTASIGEEAGWLSDGTYVAMLDQETGAELARWGFEEDTRESIWTRTLSGGVDLFVQAGSSDNGGDFFVSVSAYEMDADYCVLSLVAGEHPVVDWGDGQNCGEMFLLVEASEGASSQIHFDMTLNSGNEIYVYDGTSSVALFSAQGEGQAVTDVVQTTQHEALIRVVSWAWTLSGTITVYESVDCELSDWVYEGSCDVAACGDCELTTRTDCNQACASGSQSQSRSVLTEAAYGGADCGATSQVAACDDSGCSDCAHVIVVFYRSPSTEPYITYDLGDSSMYATVPLSASGNGQFPAADGWYSVAIGGDYVSFVFETAAGSVLSDFYEVAGDEVLDVEGTVYAYTPAHSHFVL